jgi:hypothetical protein
MRLLNVPLGATAVANTWDHFWQREVQALQKIILVAMVY